MQVGMIGLGRMGANMVRRLMRGGHRCVVHDVTPAAVEALAREGATGATSLDALVTGLAAPRVVWLMVPAAAVVRRGGLTGLFVVSDGRARLRWVALGDEAGGGVEVRAGVDAGERVVLDPADLADGQGVEAEAVP